MLMLEIKYSEKASKSLKRIAKADKKIALRIIDGIETYASAPTLATNVKILKGKFAEFKRLRIGDYRVIFDDDFSVMFVYEVKHRKEAYND